LDLKLWFFCLGLFQAHRLFFLFSLSDYIDKNSSKGDVVVTLLNGFRFDSAIATYAIGIPFLVVSLPSYFFDLKGFAYRFRFIWGGIVVFLTACISVSSIEYYKEYHDVFNDFLFGLIYDDGVAILKTILATQGIFALFYLGIIVALLFGYVTVATVWLQRRSLETAEKTRTLAGCGTLPTKILMTFLALVFLVVAGRGSIGHRPIQLKDAGVALDPFLNKAELNPYTALRYAIQNHLEIQKADGLNKYIHGDLKEAAQFYFGSATASSSLDDYAQKKAKGPAIVKPDHIFLIVMESYGTWPMLEKYSHFGVSDGLKQLSKKGIFIPAFLPASVGTMTSLGAIITGLPDVGLATNYHKTSRLIYPTAITAAFKQLGYKTQLFYGGYAPWERIADFSKDQGFDEVYGAAHMGDWLTTKEWGVDDDLLFDYVNAKSSKTEPTFTLIMTTSNHPPFNVDLEKNGIALDGIAKELATYKEAPITLRELGHFQYADQELLKFVRNMEKQAPNSLFIITGDHYGRRHVVPNPPLFERTAVPLVFYGKKILGNYKGLSNVAGSHIDIAPTLIELIAPKRFLYYSYGRNILSRDGLQLGLGQNFVVTPFKIFSTEDGAFDVVPFHPQGRQESDSRYALYKKIYNTAFGLAWWRIVKGPNLSPDP
jgi:phosphoglycerol transferase MdoB-like AlkP superfamily enzyme